MMSTNIWRLLDTWDGIIEMETKLNILTGGIKTFDINPLRHAWGNVMCVFNVLFFRECRL